MVELVLDREIRLDHAARRPAGAGHHLRQAVIGLRAEHDVHIGRAGDDLRPLGLGDAAGHRDDGGETRRLARRLDLAQPPEFGEHLLGGLVADMAGVEDDHIRRIRLGCGREADGGENVGHPARIIDVHLTAPRDHVEPSGIHAQADIPSGPAPSMDRKTRLTKMSRKGSLSSQPGGANKARNGQRHGEGQEIPSDSGPR